MTEERMMILRMIEEGKITAEQGASLLRALPGDPSTTERQQSASGAGPAASSPPPSGAAGNADGAHAAQIDMQGRLADLQSKLGDLQSKLGAAQSSASSGTGKTSLPFGLGDFNYGQFFDETLKGVSSLKSEALKTAKMAARVAQKEARRMRQEAKRTGKSFRVEINFAMDDKERPKNEDSDPERTETQEQHLTVPGERSLLILNRLGNIKAVAVGDDEPATLKLTKHVWGSSDLGALIAAITPQISLGSDGMVERIVIEAPEIDPDGVTADLELRLPATTRLNVETSFGEIHCEGFTHGLTRAESTSGDVRLLHVQSESEDQDVTLKTRSGALTVHQWAGDPIHAETVSGEIKCDGLAAASGSIRSRSGNVQIQNLAIKTDLTLETTSGEIEMRGGSCNQALTIRTQSGDVKAAALRAGRAQVETVSGDLDVEDMAAVDGSLSLKSVAGDIQAKSLQSVAVNVNTVSGDAEIGFTAPFTGSLGAVTISGDLQVTLWPNSDARVEMTTQSGSIRSGMALEQQSQSGDRFLSGVLGSGQGSVKLSSVSGDLRLKAQD